MKVAITAASGQLGSQIVRATVALLPSANVIGLARTPDNANISASRSDPATTTSRPISKRHCRASKQS